MAESQDKSYGRSTFGFEDLNVYKAAQQFRRRMYQVAKLLPGDERFALAQQMRRAAISLTNNLAEGYGRYTWQDRTHFCRQARGSLMELVDDIDICREEGYIAEAEAKLGREQAAQVLQLMNGYIGYLQKGLRDKG
jgi:four helix bundle protein